MKQGVPAQIKLFKFATKGLIFTHSYQVGDFPRISDLTNNDNTVLKVELNFSLKDNKIPCIEGSIDSNLALTCQRCLGEVNVHLKPNFKLAFVQNEQQGDNLEIDFEAILGAGEEFSTIEFITDEVLMSIPMIPMHEHECTSYKDTQTIDKQKPDNAFAILKELKNN